MRDLAVDERLRDHAGHPAAALERRVGDRAHQADVGAAVDELDPAVGQPVAEVARGGAVREVRSGLDPEKTQTRLTSGTSWTARSAAGGGPGARPPTAT